MTYYRNLAIALRSRRLRENEIALVLCETYRESIRAGMSAEQLVGAADEYAASFTRGQAYSAGHRLAALMVIVAAALVIGHSALYALQGVGPEPGTLAFWLGPLLAVVVGVGGGFLLDHRLPRRFRKECLTKA